MTAFLLATNNEKKLLEMKRILSPLGINVISAAEAGLNLGEIEETGATFAENAFIKAEAAHKKTKMPSIADDSGLMVDALSGRPGIYTARYAGENASSSDNIEKLLSELMDVPAANRTARFVTSICCILADGEIITADGECNGTIAFERKGQSGFGYDPVFLTGDGLSFAEISSDEKDSISHRGKALRALVQKLTEAEF